MAVGVSSSSLLLPHDHRLHDDERAPQEAKLLSRGISPMRDNYHTHFTPARERERNRDGEILPDWGEMGQQPRVREATTELSLLAKTEDDVVKARAAAADLFARSFRKKQ